MARKPTGGGRETSGRGFVSSHHEDEETVSAMTESLMRIIASGDVASRVEAVVKRVKNLRALVPDDLQTHGIGSFGTVGVPLEDLTEENILKAALILTEGETEIDETLERLGVGIDREIEKMDELLSRLRRTRITA
jgi:hypothetical protein